MLIGSVLIDPSDVIYANEYKVGYNVGVFRKTIVICCSVFKI